MKRPRNGIKILPYTKPTHHEHEYEKTHFSFDWALKRLLRSKANYEVLEGCLSELLKEDLEILESESNRDLVRDKSNVIRAEPDIPALRNAL